METSQRAAYRWFSVGVGSWFTSWGMNSLVFSWLVVGVLDAPAQLVGVAQTSTMLPALVLLLAGGTVADRSDPRRVITVLHLAICAPVLAMIAVLRVDALTLPVLLLYGVSFGTVSAFVMPARDALLSRVAGADMLRAVTGMTVIQFGGQALGTLAAGSAEAVGIVAVLAVQCAVLATGAFAAARLPEGPPPSPSGTSPLREITEGVRAIAARPALRGPVLLVTAVGVLFIGPFIVTFPLIVREVYAGGPAELALVLMTFPIGVILGSLVVRARGIERKGLAALAALGSGSVVLVFLSFDLPFPVFVLGALAWGLGGAVFINASRTLMQEHAPPALRGRVLSAYQLGFVGGGPVGSLLAGFTAARIGPQATLLVFGATMALFILAMALATDVRRLR